MNEAVIETPDRAIAADPVPLRPEHDRWRGFADSFWRASRRSVAFSWKSLNGRRASDFQVRNLPPIPADRWAGLFGAIDELALTYYELGRPNSLDETEFERICSEVEGLIEHHDHRGVTDDPFSHHDDPPAPEAPTIVERQVDRIAGFADTAGLDGEWMTFPSEWEPHPESPGRARWLDDAVNRQVHVALLRHDGRPRPWVILIHGSEMGRPGIDAKIFRAQRLHEELGVNVALPVLPRHGPRRIDKSSMRGSFPSMEMADNVHGLSQSIWDVRQVLSWIRTQDAPAVGVYGFSLGAYVASLLAALEPELDALVLGCPVVDLVDLFERNTPVARSSDERLKRLYARARLAHAPISPLQLDRVLPRERIVLVGATADRLSDPVHQLSRLWECWDHPEVRWVSGGHLSYFAKSRPTEILLASLADRGVCS